MTSIQKGEDSGTFNDPIKPLYTYSGGIPLDEKDADSRIAPMASNTQRPQLSTRVKTILGWPTDTISIDYYNKDGSKMHPHTVLMFVPGNPGCVGWYIGLLQELVTRLGNGYAARGCSYAGHGVDPAIVQVEQWQHVAKSSETHGRDVEIPWTVEGQIDHKIEFIDKVESEELQLMSPQSDVDNRVLPKYVFISHSIGAHMIQRLCVLRPDILRNTKLLIHLMPYTRMDAPQPQQSILSNLACSPNAVITTAKAFSHLARMVPFSWVDSMLKEHVPDGRDLAVKLIRQPTYSKNFFQLGAEEIRDVPEQPDESALRIIGKQCPISMLYCEGPDHWAPPFHMEDLAELQNSGKIPRNVQWTYVPRVVHDFIVRPKMVVPVVDFCMRAFSRTENLRSKL